MTNPSTPDHPSPSLQVVLLGGGGGTAKLAAGLTQIMPPENLTIVANTVTDHEVLGLHLSPALDGLLYALAGFFTPAGEPGYSEQTRFTLDALEAIGAPTWHGLDDRRLAVNLLRTHWLRQGYPLSWVVPQLCRRFGVTARLMPMTDSRIETVVHTDQGRLTWADYAYRRGFQPRLARIEFEGIAEAELNRDMLRAIRTADLVIFGPSNPFSSIDPILSLPGMARLLGALRVPRLAVSPVIGGQAVTGSLAKMMLDVGVEVSPFGVVQHIREVVSGFVLDPVDQIHQLRIHNLGPETHLASAAMPTPEAAAALAKTLLAFAEALR